MNFTKTIETVFKRFMPSPFAIAVLLTLLTMVLALFFTEAPTDKPHILAILSFWESGIWNNSLLVFAYQMMLILVLGHILVLSKPMNLLIVKLTNLVSNTSNAVLLVSACTMIVSFFNWGLGLIFGAIMARKVAESGHLTSLMTRVGDSTLIAKLPDLIPFSETVFSSGLVNILSQVAEDNGLYRD